MRRKNSSPPTIGLENYSILLVLIFIVAGCSSAPIQETTDIQKFSEGCYYNYNHYNEGDRILTNEPCLNCTCHKNMLMCYLRVCPFTKPIGQDCIIEKREDQCCPIITCPEVQVDVMMSKGPVGSSGIGFAEKYGCVINNKFFPEGSQVPSNPNRPCELCYCIRNSTSCLMQECTLHIDGCQPIYHKGSCCPVRYNCDHELPEIEDMSTTTTTTTERPTEGFIMTTTGSSVSEQCTHNGELYMDGALIETENPCDNCYCMKGKIVCAVQECTISSEYIGQNCTPVKASNNECCPQSFTCDDYGIESTTLHQLTITTQLIGKEETTMLPDIAQPPISEEDFKLQKHIDDEEIEITHKPISDESATIENVTTKLQEPISLQNDTVTEITQIEPTKQPSKDLEDKDKTTPISNVPEISERPSSSKPSEDETTSVSVEAGTEGTSSTEPSEVEEHVTTISDEGVTDKALEKLPVDLRDQITPSSDEDISHVTSPKSVEIAEETTIISVVNHTEKLVPSLPVDQTTEGISKEISLSQQITTAGDITQDITEKPSSVSLESITSEPSSSKPKDIEAVTVSLTDSATEKPSALDKESEVGEITTPQPITDIIAKETGETDLTTEQIDTSIPFSIPGEGDCLVDKNTYKNNTTVPSTNECEYECICVSSMIKCKTIECAQMADLDCSIKEPAPGACCPTFICPETGTESIQNKMEQTTVTPDETPTKHALFVPELGERSDDTGLPETSAEREKDAKKDDSSIDEMATVIPTEKPEYPDVQSTEAISVEEITIPSIENVTNKLFEQVTVKPKEDQNIEITEKSPESEYSFTIPSRTTPPLLDIATLQPDFAKMPGIHEPEKPTEKPVPTDLTTPSFEEEIKESKIQPQESLPTTKKPEGEGIQESTIVPEDETMKPILEIASDSHVMATTKPVTEDINLTEPSNITEKQSTERPTEKSSESIDEETPITGRPKDESTATKTPTDKEKQPDLMEVELTPSPSQSTSKDEIDTERPTVETKQTLEEKSGEPSKPLPEATLESSTYGIDREQSTESATQVSIESTEKPFITEFENRIEVPSDKDKDTGIEGKTEIPEDKQPGSSTIVMPKKEVSTEESTESSETATEKPIAGTDKPLIQEETKDVISKPSETLPEDSVEVSTTQPEGETQKPQGEELESTKPSIVLPVKPEEEESATISVTETPTSKEETKIPQEEPAVTVSVIERIDKEHPPTSQPPIPIESSTNEGEPSKPLSEAALESSTSGIDIEQPPESATQISIESTEKPLVKEFENRTEVPSDKDKDTGIEGETEIPEDRQPGSSTIVVPKKEVSTEESTESSETATEKPIAGTEKPLIQEETKDVISKPSETLPEAVEVSTSRPEGETQKPQGEEFESTKPSILLSVKPEEEESATIPVTEIPTSKVETKIPQEEPAVTVSVIERIDKEHTSEIQPPISIESSTKEGESGEPSKPHPEAALESSTSRIDIEPSPESETQVYIESTEKPLVKEFENRTEVPSEKDKDMGIEGETEIPEDKQPDSSTIVVPKKEITTEKSKESSEIATEEPITHTDKPSVIETTKDSTLKPGETLPEGTDEISTSQPEGETQKPQGEELESTKPSIVLPIKPEEEGIGSIPVTEMPTSREETTKIPQEPAVTERIDEEHPSESQPPISIESSTSEGESEEPSKPLPEATLESSTTGIDVEQPPESGTQVSIKSTEKPIVMEFENGTQVPSDIDKDTGIEGETEIPEDKQPGSSTTVAAKKEVTTEVSTESSETETEKPITGTDKPLIQEETKDVIPKPSETSPEDSVEVSTTQPKGDTQKPQGEELESTKPSIVLPVKPEEEESATIPVTEIPASKEETKIPQEEPAVTESIIERIDKEHPSEIQPPISIESSTNEGESKEPPKPVSEGALESSTSGIDIEQPPESATQISIESTEKPLVKEFENRTEVPSDKDKDTEIEGETEIPEDKQPGSSTTVVPKKEVTTEESTESSETATEKPSTSTDKPSIQEEDKISKPSETLPEDSVEVSTTQPEGVTEKAQGEELEPTKPSIMLPVKPEDEEGSGSIPVTEIPTSKEEAKIPQEEQAVTESVIERIDKEHPLESQPPISIESSTKEGESREPSKPEQTDYTTERPGETILVAQDEKIAESETSKPVEPTIEESSTTSVERSGETTFMPSEERPTEKPERPDYKTEIPSGAITVIEGVTEAPSKDTERADHVTEISSDSELDDSNKSDETETEKIPEKEKVIPSTERTEKPEQVDQSSISSVDMPGVSSVQTTELPQLTMELSTEKDKLPSVTSESTEESETAKPSESVTEQVAEKEPLEPHTETPLKSSTEKIDTEQPPKIETEESFEITSESTEEDKTLKPSEGVTEKLAEKEPLEPLTETSIQSSTEKIDTEQPPKSETEESHKITSESTEEDKTAKPSEGVTEQPSEKEPLEPLTEIPLRSSTERIDTEQPPKSGTEESSEIATEKPFVITKDGQEPSKPLTEPIESVTERIDEAQSPESETPVSIEPSSTSEKPFIPIKDGEPEEATITEEKTEIHPADISTEESVTIAVLKEETGTRKPEEVAEKETTEKPDKATEGKPEQSTERQTTEESDQVGADKLEADAAKETTPKPDEESAEKPGEIAEKDTTEKSDETTASKPEEDIKKETISPVEVDTSKPSHEEKPEKETEKPEKETEKPEKETEKPEKETDKPEKETDKPEKETEKPTSDEELSASTTTKAPLTTKPTFMPSMPGYMPPDMPTEYYDEPDDADIFGPGTCRYGGKLFVSAQQIPRDDPCDFCFCFRSDIICLQQSCPPPISGCNEEPIQGFCCPRYECPVSMGYNENSTTSTTTTTLPPHFLHRRHHNIVERNGCQIQGVSYKVGDKIPSASGPCMQCTCGGDGQMQCNPKSCTPEPMLRQMIAVVASRRRR